MKIKLIEPTTSYTLDLTISHAEATVVYHAMVCAIDRWTKADRESPDRAIAIRFVNELNDACALGYYPLKATE